MESGHQIETRNTAYFRHDYDCEHADMRRLYEQAKIDQWNAATDIDWARPLEGDGGLIADDLVDIHGTKFWDRLSSDQRVELNRYVSRWRLSTLMHGEHGAMLVCSQLVENVHGQDAKLFQATQVVDEGRHNEVLHRYLALRLDGESYPLAAYEDMGFDRSDIEEIRQLRRQRAAGGDETAFRKFFRRDLHAGLVRNMRKVGVLTARVAPDLEALGISLAAA